ncbi:HTH domain-containing protein [Fulvivirga ligni]|uniref:HTH domain-containing protein n=1 Tax=Fulvivirga ligni TaxID=2904246 RepID=UPI001F25FC90|nr:HTH domain-containing protein [Fulvivirga ligni]UII19395.1 HTH domain-containing protein [Fulvivirga ligni]
MKFLELAKKVLEESQKPLSGTEIWRLAKDKGYVDQLETSGKTPEQTLLARIYTAANNPNNLDFNFVGARPKLFYLPGRTPAETLNYDEEEILLKEENDNKTKYKEKDLHPVLAYYIRNHMDAYPKTLNHSKSRKKEFGAWVHPDMVACYFPQNHWKHDVYDLSQMMGDAQIGLFSFELKTHLSFGNLRESFFQAVSNSSWAHEGYLVAAEISAEADFMRELGRLSNSFGIGVIRLNLSQPDDSEIIYDADIRDFVDWDTVDKLMMNADFREFIARIKNDISSKEVRDEKYDKIKETEELIQFFADKI